MSGTRRKREKKKKKKKKRKKQKKRKECKQIIMNNSSHKIMKTIPNVKRAFTVSG